jgi:hypothetical protein
MGNLMIPECLECLEKFAKDSAHRIKDIDCANCTTKCITIFTPKIYNCEQCGNIMVLDDVLSSECPWCRIPIYKHKKCGSKVTLK